MDTQCRVAVDLLSLADTESYLMERVRLAVQPDLPPILSDEAELWQCGFCPAHAECERIHGGPVGKAAQSTTTQTTLEEM